MHNDKTVKQRIKPAPIKQRPDFPYKSVKGDRIFRDIKSFLDAGGTFTANNFHAFEK